MWCYSNRGEKISMCNFKEIDLCETFGLPSKRDEARCGAKATPQARATRNKTRSAGRSKARAYATTGRSKTQRAEAATPGKKKQDPEGRSRNAGQKQGLGIARQQAETRRSNKPTKSMTEASAHEGNVRQSCNRLSQHAN